MNEQNNGLNITHDITTRPKQGAMGCASIIGVLLLFAALGTATTFGLQMLGLTKDKLEVRESGLGSKLNQGVESEVEDNISINNNEMDINIKLNNDNIKVKCKINNNNEVNNNNKDKNNKLDVECEEIIRDREQENVYRYSGNQGCNVLAGDRCWYPMGR